MKRTRRRARAAIMLVVMIGAMLFVANPAIAPEDRAEKLKIDDNGWERDGQQFVVKMLCKFGIATAGEHAGFKAVTDLSIYKIDENGWDSAKAETPIVKEEGAEKYEDGYIRILPTFIKWDRQGYAGLVEVTATVSVVGPSGNTIGKPSVATEIVSVGPPDGDVPGGFDPTWTAIR